MINNRRTFIKNNTAFTALLSIGGLHSLNKVADKESIKNNSLEQSLQSTWPISSIAIKLKLCVGAPLDGIRNQYPGGGGYAGETYNVGFTKAMMLAVLSS